MPTCGEIIADAARQLQPITETPRLDAEILLAHALGLSRARLLARLRDPISPESSSAFQPLLQRRLNHEPIAYILGSWEFFSLDFITRPPILVPRPETEHLVEAALEFIGTAPARVLDLCTGTGCVAIAIAKNAPAANVTATDINPAAVELARANAAAHKVNVDVLSGNLFGPVEPQGYDVIVSNPPYVAENEWADLPAVIRLHEDPAALLAGTDGLSIIRRIATEAPDFLRPGGLLALEIGDTHYAAAEEMFTALAYTGVRPRRDLAGIPRIIQGLRPH